MVDVQTIFNNIESIEIFERLINSGQRDPKNVFKFMYNFIYGNVIKKELDFMNVLT